MDTKEQALLAYLEFNLIGLVDTLKPYIREDADIQEVYKHANDVLKEMRVTIEETTGSVSKSS